jgi:hypothetical protein
MRLSATIANSLWIASGVLSWQRFQKALRDPAAAQLGWLRRHLERNAGSAFAREHRLEGVRSYEEFTGRVPLVDHEEIAPRIKRIQNGETSVLTVDPVTHLIPTGGSSGPRKLIPFTKGLQRDFDQAIAPWICDLACQQPGIIGGRGYWSITPPVQSAEAEASAVPVGFADDADYLGGVKGHLVRAVLVCPRVCAADDKFEGFQMETLRCLLSAQDLRLISVWHPSFLTLLLEALPQYWDALTSELPGLRHRNPRQPQELWPNLQLISCWGDAHARLAMEGLRPYFPGVQIQPKGLLATEAFVSVPLQGGHPVAVRSHFFEFMDEGGDARRVHELREHETYEVVVTTSGGLWRYRLGDLIRVDGWVGRTPSIRFLGRRENVSDLCGEKLSEAFVAEVILRAIPGAPAAPQFAMLAPRDELISGYTLYWEGAADAELADRFDQLLRRNPQYDLCRRLGQLQKVEVCPVRGGYRAYAAHEVQKGRRLGGIKPIALSSESGWSRRFEPASPPVDSFNG